MDYSVGGNSSDDNGGGGRSATRDSPSDANSAGRSFSSTPTSTGQPAGHLFARRQGPGTGSTGNNNTGPSPSSRTSAGSAGTLNTSQDMLNQSVGSNDFSVDQDDSSFGVTSFDVTSGVLPPTK
jgi:hypothetical protein